MVYNVTDNRISIDGWFFEMDTQYNLHVYAKGMEYFDMVRIGYELDYEEFKCRCKQWLVENR